MMSYLTLTSLYGGSRRGFASVVATWAGRARTRRHLKRLDSHLLRDIGLSDLAAQREVQRPFWD
ncbi:DUF1127 domain-containing protein [Pontibrevibacter nitratireducens]|uniref:DUF1127 domain-containing protein n=2 Tax=Pontivivens nitratireducens TaxID=2758038 RepID=A0A6G7VLR6_9RHOB|nr:DUF1127 domain-containing protein [Pontibrevibacter nitratireducens]